MTGQTVPILEIMKNDEGILFIKQQVGIGVAGKLARGLQLEWRDGQSTPEALSFLDQAIEAENALREATPELDVELSVGFGFTPEFR